MARLMTTYALVAVALALTPYVAASTPYSVSTADYMIDFCAAAYCPEDKIQSWDCVTCKLHPQVTDISIMRNSATDSQAFAAYDAETDRVIVAFRGTDPLNIKNWIDDLDFFKTPYPPCASSGCEVHRGFYHSYLDIANATRKAVHQLLDDHRGAELYVTGHSLGAAEAELCALDMAEQVEVPHATYTFGCPRVGDSDHWYKYFAKMIPDNHYRVTHYADPVPHLPPESFGFHHTATEVWYNEFETKYKVCNGSGEDPSCADSVLFPFSIADHVTYMGFNLTETFLACRL